MQREPEGWAPYGRIGGVDMPDFFPAGSYWRVELRRGRRVVFYVWFMEQVGRRSGFRAIVELLDGHVLTPL